MNEWHSVVTDQSRHSTANQSLQLASKQLAQVHLNAVNTMKRLLVNQRANSVFVDLFLRYKSFFKKDLVLRLNLYFVLQCEYTVQMKKGSGSGNIERTLPAVHHFKMETNDVSGIRFAVIKSINQADVVVTVEISEPEHIKTIKLNLYRDDQPDVVLNTIKLDASPLVFLPVLPMDGKKYYLQLESSLGRHGFDFQTSGVSFTTNVSVQHLSLRFEPKRKSIEATETTQVSIRSVLFILLCLVSCYYYQALLPLLGRLVVITSNAIKPNRRGSSGYSPYDSVSGSSSNPNHAIFSEQELALMESSSSSAAARKRVKPRRAQ